MLCQYRKIGAIVSCLAVVLLAGCFGTHVLAGDSQESIQALEWRCVGPHVGNRGCTVSMHPTKKNVARTPRSWSSRATAGVNSSSGPSS